MNRYLVKIASLEEEFKPDLTPEQMHTLGVLIHPGSQYQDGDPKQNFFGVSASLKEWPQEWLRDDAPVGWYEWYQGYANGKRTNDDERQIKRWKSFKARMLGGLKQADPTLSDMTVQPKRRQALLNWGIAPGLDIAKALETGSVNRYLEKVARHVRLRHKPKGEIREAIEGELTGRALDATKSKKKRKHGHEKVAIALTLYECPVTGKKKWVAGDKAGPEGWVVAKKSYKKFEKK